MKKLIYVTTVFDPGAIPNILTDLHPHIRAGGWEAHVVTLQSLPKDRTALDKAGRAGLKVHSLGCKAWQVVKSVRALRRYLHQESPDLIHSHLGRADIFSAWAKPAAVPLVTTFHSVRRNFPLATLWGFRCTDRKVAHRTGVSQTAIDSMYSDGFLRSPHSVIRNPVDPERLLPEKTREEVRESWGVEGDRKVLLSVGRFVSAKGQIHLMDALPVLREKFPGIRLVMAGSGPLEKNLRQRARDLKVEDCVIWAGFSSSVPDLFQGADAVVFPSLWEGMGLVPLEAILRSRPVALSDLPALQEFLEPGASVEYFLPGSGQSVAEGVIRLLERPDMEVTMDLIGRLPDLLGRFSASTIAKDYLNLYSSLTGGDL